MSSPISLLSLLRGDNFLAINRSLAHKIGLLESICLGDLCSKYEYHRDKGELTTINGDPTYFFACIDDMQERTTLSRSTQAKCLRRLKLLGLVTYVLKGAPPKRYFKLNVDRILEVFGVKDISTNLSKMEIRISKSDISKCKNLTNQSADFSKSYNKDYEIRDMRSDKKEIGAPKVARPNEHLISHGSNVKLSTADYETLCQKFTKQVVDDCIEKINDWIDSEGKKPKKNYAATIRMWIKRDRENSRVDTKKYPPKKEDWQKVNYAKAQDIKAKNPIKLKHLNIDCYYAANRTSPNLEIDFRIINPDELLQQIRRISDVHDLTE